MGMFAARQPSGNNPKGKSNLGKIPRQPLPKKARKAANRQAKQPKLGKQ